MDRPRQARRHVVQAGFLLGAGLAAITHVAVLASLLGWHHIWEAAPGGAPRGSDGAMSMLGVTLIVWGLVLLVKARGRLDTPRVPRRLGGAMLVGGGGFLLLEGLLLHHVLGLHRVNPTSATLGWDIFFLIFASALALSGAVILRRVKREVRRLEEGPPPRGQRRHGLPR